MGTLDEAIREHLELKRRRGATDSELQRLEDEAFGPPSRPGEPDFPEPAGEPAEQSGNGRAHEEAAEAQTALYHEGPGGELELGELDLERDVEGPAHEPVAPEEPGDVEGSEPPIETLDTVEHEVPEAEREASPEEPGPEQASEPERQEPSAPTEGEETAAERESGEQEDVLADTPEFLRDRPEDDELWFEQGKPKDFDF
jgi:hypothetical protein